MKLIEEHLNNTLKENEKSIIYINKLMKKGKYFDYIYNFYKNNSNVKANLYLLSMIIQGFIMKDPNKIYKYCYEGAENNDLVLEQYLAYCYLKGFGVKVNLEEAKKIYNGSMKKGNLNSAYDLGLIYMMENNPKYIKIFKNNAMKNHLDSILVMIYLCDKEIENKQDIYKWSKKYANATIKKEHEDDTLEFMEFINDYSSGLDKSYLKHIDDYSIMMLSLIEKNFLIDKEAASRKIIESKEVKSFFLMLDNVADSINDLINYF
jgi:hypothetical protein